MASYSTEQNGIVTYDYAAIEAALMRLGATAEEADMLTDILHYEGWGGAESDITDEVLVAKLDWYRDTREEVNRG